MTGGRHIIHVSAFLAVVVLATPTPAEGQKVESPGPLSELSVFEGSWHADAGDFQTTLTYRWILEGRVMEASNSVLYGEADTVTYHGFYAWDGESEEIVYLVAASDGEIHRGHAYWDDGDLWHEARVSGGDITGYASVLRPVEDGLEFYADFSQADATPAILDGDPLTYKILPGSREAKSNFIVLLKLRHDLWERYAATGVWPDDPEANEALRGHVSYWNDQWEAGNVILTGGMGGDYWDNVAQIVLNVTDRAEAEAIVRGDPAVQRHVFKTQVRPFTVHRVEVPRNNPD